MYIDFGITNGSNYPVSVSGNPTSFKTSPIVARLNGYKAIVWADNRNGHYDLYARQLMQNGLVGTDMLLISAPGDQINPVVVSNFLLWRDSRTGNFDIWAVDLQSQNLIPFSIITLPNGHRSNFDAEGQWLVYEDTRNGNPDIYAYNAGTNTEIPIDTTPIQSNSPKISGNLVAYINYPNTVVIYQLTTTRSFTLPLHPNVPPMLTSLDFEFPWVVYEDSFTNDAFAFDISRSLEIPLLSDGHASYQLKPKISQGRVIWEQDDSGMGIPLTILGHDLTNC